MSVAVEIERSGPVAILRLCRPPANAMNLGLAEEAAAAFAALERDDGVGALVVTGSERFFSAGIDLKEVPGYGPDEQRRLVALVNRVFFLLYGFGRPVVAAVNGHALGGGFILALAADYRVGTTGPFKLGLREVRAGISFPICALEVVRGELGAGAARRLALTARDLDPQGALAEGALDELVPPDRVLARALEVAAELAALPVTAYVRTKRDLRHAALARMEAAVASGHDPLLEAWLSPESESASRRILEERK